jgi:hypothetical protein
MLGFRPVHILARQVQPLEHHQPPTQVLPPHLTPMDQSRLRGCLEQMQVSMSLSHTCS